MGLTSPYTWMWIAIGLAALILEGVAFFNSRRGDTLSEHAWAWLGVGKYRVDASTSRCMICGSKVVRLPDGSWVHADLRHATHFAARKEPVTPKWTLRLARTAIIFFLVWLGLHFLTGGWV